MIKLGILDDHSAILHGVSKFLEEREMQQIMVENTLHALVHQLEIQTPDVLIVDVILPDVEGLDHFEQIKQQFPEIPLIAYTSLSSPTLIKMLYKLGVEGYISKNDDLETLVKGIHAVYSGKRFYPEELADSLSKISIHQQEIIKLSSREKEVLELIALGLRNQEISGKLFISGNTIDTYRKSLFVKFNVTNIAALINQAKEMGFL